MKRLITLLICFIFIGSLSLPIFAQEDKAEAKPAAQQTAAKKKKEYEDFNKVTEDSKKYQGYFTLYQKKENLYCEIKPSQLEKPFLLMASIARGIGSGYILSGMTMDEWLLEWKRVGDKVHLVRKNVRFRADKGSPIAEAVNLGYSDSVLFALKLESVHPQSKSLLVNISPVFISDLLPLAGNLGGARFDKARSTWGAIKAFPKNVELRVNAVYSGGGSRTAVPDSRGMQVAVHYSLSQLPNNDYQPRFADDRMGHFMTTVKDYSLQTSDEPFIRYVNRWHLEKADKDKKLSPPKEPIIFYIEKTVPHRFRPYVRQGILEWNKAFEKAGFIDAIEARIQQDHEDWDPEDARYNTIRWIVGASFAIGPSRVNPLTGQILDADILVGESWIRYWQREWTTFFDELEHEREHPIDHDSRFHCQMATGLARQIGFMASVMQARGAMEDGGELPEEFIGQALKALIMHEVGHTLGLRHNFKASTIHTLDEVNKQKDEPLVGSVMEYDAVNIAPEGKKQGHYYTPTIGPWDYWVVEYAYKPVSGNKPEAELPELQKIASRAAASELRYGTDGDASAYQNRDLDPLVNRWDMGADPLEFAKQRREIVAGLWDEIADKVTTDGMGYQRVRRAFRSLLGEYTSSMYLAARFIGGQYHHRDHKGDKDGRLPYVPVSAKKQREALAFIKEHALSDKVFDFPAELLNSIAITRWSDWGTSSNNSSRLDYPIHDVILRNQGQILSRLLDANVLSRVQDTELKFSGEDAFTMPELFTGITDAVWVELDKNADANQWTNSDAFISSFRRGLQREHLKLLIKLVLAADSGTPEDARSLARLHLTQINGRLKTVLQNSKAKLDEYSVAHLEESQDRVDKALAANFNVEKR